jgi:4-diphosphocytidyl-2-C-methyl-D-erythritol kinase
VFPEFQVFPLASKNPSSITLPSYAKINLFLEVLGKRPDGYHELQTVMQEVSLHDTMSFTRIPHGIELDCDSPEIPSGESNLAWRAAFLMQEKYPGRGGIRIVVKKRIPVGGGMGGGSSNAATTLKAINTLWKLRLTTSKLQSLAAQIGSDAPFFIPGKTAICTGRGEKVRQIRLKIPLWLLLIFPGFPVSTKEVYANLQTFLTTPFKRVKLILGAKHGNRAGHGSIVPFNRLELPAFALRPVLRRLKRTLHNACSGGALLSGSGSSLFGICQSRKEANLAKKIVDGIRKVITMVVYARR